VPKTLATNGGNDAIDSLLAVRAEQRDGGVNVGVDAESGEPMDAAAEGVYDCVRVVRQIIQGAAMLSTNLLLVDEIIAAGKATGGGQQQMMQQ